eukprot:EC794327.1.p1 GENE.EC794327.1~~EC794327.1.p1  ORF type:complete len:154 (+),score=26.91 EC794327.1:144-605(+)
MEWSDSSASSAAPSSGRPRLQLSMVQQVVYAHHDSSSEGAGYCESPSASGGFREDELEVVGLLGSGAFSQVYLARHTADGQFFAVKAVSENFGVGPDSVCDPVAREKVVVRALRRFQIQSPVPSATHVLQYYGTFTSGDQVCFVLEYMDWGSL